MGPFPHMAPGMEEVLSKTGQEESWDQAQGLHDTTDCQRVVDFHENQAVLDQICQALDQTVNQAVVDRI